MKQIVEISGRRIEIEIPASGYSGRALVGGREISFDYRPGSAGNPGSILIDGSCHTVEISSADGSWQVRVDEKDLTAIATDERREKLAALNRNPAATTASAGKIKAPMPGLVIKLEAEKGVFVEKGTGVAIIEAMKMENEIKTPVGGTVSEIAVVIGQSVEKGQLLMTVLP